MPRSRYKTCIDGIYPKRLIAFVDILGFKDLVSEANKDFELFSKLLKVLRTIEEEKKWSEKQDNEIASSFEKEVSIFSDTIVISYKNFAPGAVTYLMFDLISLYTKLMWLGVYIRGAVCFGNLYHNKNIILGEGLIKAYQLESKLSYYPRIIFSDDVAKEAEKEGSLKFLRQDFDGIYYVDCLKFAFIFVHTLSKDVTHKVYFQQVRKNITNLLKSSNKSSELLSKVRWLALNFNRVLDEIVKLEEKLSIKRFQL